VSYIIVDLDGTLVLENEQPNQPLIDALNEEVMSGNAQIIGDTDNRIPRGTNLAQSDLAPISTQKITTLHVTEGKLFRYAKAVIRAPGPGGHLLVGYDMERRLIKDAGELVNLKVAFACAVDQSNMRINQGSFGRAMVPALENMARNPSAKLSWTPTVGNERIIASVELDSTSDRCVAILGESTHPSTKALLIVEIFGWLTLTSGLVIFIVGALMARRHKKRQPS
jgi:type IV secretory pathway TrbD component